MYTEAHAAKMIFFRHLSSRTSHVARVREKPLTEKRVHPRRRRRRGGGDILEEWPEGLSPSLLTGDALVLRGSGLLDVDDEIARAVQYH